ncbi:MAG: RHS repeat domain-containing protein [Phototrophicaceae bacterium]
MQEGNSTRFEYNAQDQLTRIQLPDTMRIDYEYDHLGNRVYQEAVGSQNPTNYLWDEFSRFGDAQVHTFLRYNESSDYSLISYNFLNKYVVDERLLYLVRPVCIFAKQKRKGLI